jgi:hypothetical protein
MPAAIGKCNEIAVKYSPSLARHSKGTKQKNLMDFFHISIKFHYKILIDTIDTRVFLHQKFTGHPLSGEGGTGKNICCG